MTTARWCLSLLFLMGCSREPDDLRPWQPSDHEHTDQPSGGQVAAAPDASRPASRSVMGIDEVVLVAWKQNCVSCHGVIGRGDGPRGPLTRARNLTDQKWQASVSDRDIADAIKNGRGAMPAFELPDATIEGMVKLIRLVGRPQRAADAGTAPSEDAGASATPAAPSAATPSPGKAGSQAPTQATPSPAPAPRPPASAKP